MQICTISGKETHNKFKNFPIHREVIKFAEKFRDYKNSQAINGHGKTTTRKVLIVMNNLKMKAGGWEKIKEALEMEMNGEFENDD